MKPATLLTKAEHAVKAPIWGCQMCGQCVLHDTALPCPMTCPKTLRNGPCGGVRANGHCEVKPEMECVWVQAWDGAQRMEDGMAILAVQKPVERNLEGSSAWLRMVREKAPGPAPAPAEKA